MKAFALYDCVADEESELSFNVGDEILDIEPSPDQDWFIGTCKQFRGLFPGNYVQFIHEDLNVNNSNNIIINNNNGNNNNDVSNGINPSNNMQTAIRKKNVVDVRQQMLNKSSELASSRKRATTSEPLNNTVGKPNLPSTLTNQHSNRSFSAGNNFNQFTNPNPRNTFSSSFSSSTTSSINSTTSSPPPPTPQRPPIASSKSFSVADRFANKHNQMSSSFSNDNIIKNDTPPALPRRDDPSINKPITNVGSINPKIQSGLAGKPNIPSPPSKPPVAKKPINLVSNPVNITSKSSSLDELTSDVINKYLIDYPRGSSRIEGATTRQLWLKTGLDHANLGIVWELVDINKKGYLLKSEYIVGMWLIEKAKLSGKPITNVPEHIWESARRYA